MYVCMYVVCVLQACKQSATKALYNLHPAGLCRMTRLLGHSLMHNPPPRAAAPAQEGVRAVAIYAYMYAYVFVDTINPPYDALRNYDAFLWIFNVFTIDMFLPFISFFLLLFQLLL